MFESRIVKNKFTVLIFKFCYSFKVQAEFDEIIGVRDLIKVKMCLAQVRQLRNNVLMANSFFLWLVTCCRMGYLVSIAYRWIIPRLWRYLWTELIGNQY